MSDIIPLLQEFGHLLSSLSCHVFDKVGLCELKWFDELLFSKLTHSVKVFDLLSLDWTL